MNWENEVTSAGKNMIFETVDVRVAFVDSTTDFSGLPLLISVLKSLEIFFLVMLTPISLIIHIIAQQKSFAFWKSISVLKLLWVYPTCDRFYNKLLFRLKKMIHIFSLYYLSLQ